MEALAGKASQTKCSLASLFGSCALLALVLAPPAVLFGWYGYTKYGPSAITAALVAAAICWSAASLALIATFIGQRMNCGVQGILGGMLFRMGLPLAAGLYLHNAGGPLAEAGIFSMILGLYLCSLVVETILSLRFLPRTSMRLSKAL